MSANTNLELVNLDFTTLKNSFKNYLRSQDKFSDYDFDGSNISVLLDVLAYNTYLNSFYLNMVSSEMFLDSAQLRDSVISHAKELNYVPRSFQSASARVNITVTPSSSVDFVTMLKGTSFTSRVGGNTFTFSVNENLVQSSNTNSFVFENVDLYEGDLVSESFVYTSNTSTPQVVLSNPTVDTRSLEVYVYEDNGTNILTYQRGSTFLGLNANSQVFFVQPSRNDLYEIVFGNGTQGREPKNGSIVVVGYRICSGELPNGASVFSPNGVIDGHANVQVTTVSSASGGLIHETLQSIKKNAPRAFQTQERAVTASDYKIILSTQFPEIESLNVFGGEDADPPQYGRVFVCVDLRDADGVPEYKKTIYRNYLRTVTPLSIDPVFIDPDFLNLRIESNVKYNLNTINITESSLSTLIFNKIQTFNEVNLDQFDVTFRYSNLVSDIDDTNTSILSNETLVYPYKEITPLTTANNTFVINFYNKLYSDYTEAASTTHRSQDVHSVYSSTFTYNSQTCRLEDDNAGKLNIVAISGDSHIILTTVGTVDYETGRLVVENFRPDSYSGPMKIFITTDSNDVNALRNTIVRIRNTDIVVTLESQRR